VQRRARRRIVRRQGWQQRAGDVRTEQTGEGNALRAHDRVADEREREAPLGRRRANPAHVAPRVVDERRVGTERGGPLVHPHARCDGSSERLVRGGPREGEDEVRIVRDTRLQRGGERAARGEQLARARRCGGREHRRKHGAEGPEVAQPAFDAHRRRASRRGDGRRCGRCGRTRLLA
jgi:hypothetical protein